MNLVAEIKPFLFLGSAPARTKEYLQKNTFTFVVNGTVKKICILFYH